MAGSLSRDVQLIFRGEDRASPTIKGVRKEVRDLTDAIRQQLTAAEQGEGSIDDLARAYKALQAAQGDVGEITRLAVAYENLVDKHEKQAAKAEEARAKEAALAAQIAAAEQPTKRLINSRDAATRAADRAAEKEAELAAEVKRAGEALEAAGGDASNFARTQDMIRKTALDTARAIRDGAEAMDAFQAAQGRSGGDFSNFTGSLNLPKTQIDFLSQLENRVEALASAQARATAENERSIADTQRRNALLDQAKQRIEAAANAERSWSAAMNEAEQSARRLEQAANFRSIASEIEAGARDVSRFGAQSDNAEANVRRLGDAIQGILNPTTAAARTLDGVNQAIAQSEAVIDGAKRRLSEYNEEHNRLVQAQAGLVQMGALVDQFRQQEAVTARASAAFEAAQADVLRLSAAFDPAAENAEELLRAMRQAEATVEQAGRAMQRETTRLAELERKMEQAGIDVRNLAAAEDQLVASANRAAAAQQNLANKTGGKGNFLGLNPMELQNVGFQINDIIVGLASGQRPLTVFIQQGAQLGQIVPGAFGAIVRYIPQLAVLAAVLGTVAAVISRTADESRRLAQGKSIVDSMGGNVGTTAQEFAGLAKSLEKAGVEADKTRESLVSLAADGLSTEQMEQYIDTAINVAKVTGVDVPAAIETLRDSFQGGIEDIIELDSQTNFLNETELDHIQTLYEQGRADEARAEALAIYNERMGETARNAEGPWSRAIDNLGLAWQRFIGFMSDTRFIREMTDYLNDLAVGANYVAAILAGKSFEEARKEALGILPAPRAPRAVADPNRRTNAGREMAVEQERALRAAQASTAEQKRALAVEEARIEAQSKGLSNLEVQETMKRAGAIFDAEEAKRQEKRDKAAGKRADAAARRRQRQAEAAARAIASAEEQLQRQLEQIDAAVANKQTESLERRLSAIDSQYAKLFRQIDEYAEKTGGKGLIGGRTIEQARDHVRLQQSQLRNYETMEFREKELNALLQERSEKLDAIDDRVARGIISPEAGLAEAETVINDIAGRVGDMAINAIAFAESLRGAVPNPQLEAFIAKMQTALQNNSGGQNVRAMRDRRTGAIDTAEDGLNSIIDRRNQLIEHENLLVQMGLKSRNEAQRTIEGHYLRTSELIRAQIQNVRALAAAFANDADPAMRLYYENLMARLEAADLQADFVDARFTEMKSSIDNLLTSNIVGFIDSVAQAFAALATKQTDVLGFLSAIGTAFLDMIAKTLQGIAQLIIQMMVLNAVEAVTGIPVKAMLRLMGGVGVFHDGGIAGQAGGRKRMVHPAVFANAPRYHSGGIAGLAPNETAAILKKGEEVLTEADPRHRNNGGGAGGEGDGMRSIRQLLVLGDDQVAAAMASSAGEDVVITHIRRNKATIKQVLDS